MLQFNFGFLSICICCLIVGSNGKFIAWPFDLEGFFCSVLIRIWVGHHSKTLKVAEKEVAIVTTFEQKYHSFLVDFRSIKWSHKNKNYRIENSFCGS